MQRYCPSTIILVLLLVTGFPSAKAQDATCQASLLKNTKLHPLKTDVSAYVKGGLHNCGKLWENTNHLSSARGASKQFYGSYADMGACATMSVYDSWSVVSSLGYRQECFAFEKGLFNNDGIRSHWLTADVGINITNYVVLGAQTDFFLGSHTQSNGDPGYSGIGKDCFNPVAVGIYAGIHFAILKFSAEFRYGFQIRHHFSADKLAYHNMERTSLKQEFFELRLSFNLFTTKSRYNIINAE